MSAVITPYRVCNRCEDFNVGYQEIAATNAGAYSWIAATFEKVDGTTLKLSDLSFKEAQGQTKQYLFFLDKDGASLKDGSDSVKFLYVHPGWCTGAARSSWVPGWYWVSKGGVEAKAAQFKLGSESVCWANDYEVPYGTQLCVERTGGDAATLMFNGSVCSTDNEFEAPNAGGYSWTGNVMPKDYQLKDFQFKEAQGQTKQYLFFLDKDGASLKDGSDSVKFLYVHPGWCTGAARSSWVPGWYWVSKGGVEAKAAQFKLGSESVCWANEYKIPAGTGFGIERTGSDPATLIVPTPLD